MHLVVCAVTERIRLGLSWLISAHSHTDRTGSDADVALRDVQDSMGHRDPRTTRLYDRTRGNLSRNATYAVAAALADD